MTTMPAWALLGLLPEDQFVVRNQSFRKGRGRAAARSVAGSMIKLFVPGWAVVNRQPEPGRADAYTPSAQAYTPQYAAAA